MDKRIENPEVKEYLINFVANKLENCDLFTEVFGRGFATNRLNMNVDKVYTNEVDGEISVGGYYKESDSSITICKEGKDGKILSPSDIENDKLLQEATTHEAVHAILRKLKKECVKRKLKGGTGILERYKKGGELGRGFNEGLTNWIVRKAGIKTHSYPELTNLVEQIELAIGSKETMKINKGNIEKNVIPRLKMSLEEGKAFLGQCDTIYALTKSLEKASHIKNVVSYKLEYKESNGFLDDKRIEKNEKDYSKLRDIKLGRGKRIYDFYERYIRENNLEDSLETEINFFSDFYNDCEKEYNDFNDMMQKLIFEKYFKDEYQELKQSEEISEEQYKKYMTFCNLMPKGGEYTKLLKTDFKQFARDYLQNKISQAEEKYKEGKLSINEFMHINELIDYESSGTYFELRNDLISKISNQINPDNPEPVIYLMREFLEREKIQEINDYTIFEIVAGEKEDYLYFKNGEPEFSKHSFRKIEISANDEKQRYEDFFDFTDAIEEDTQSVIQQFLELKENVERKNPDAKITILDTNIIIDDNGEKSIYMISGPDLLPAMIKFPEPTRINFAKEEKQEIEKKEVLPAVIKQSFFSKILLKIKRKLFMNKGDGVYYNKLGEENDKSENSNKVVDGNRKDRVKEFRRELQDMSNYAPVINETSNSSPNSLELSNEEQEEEQG